MPVMRVLEDDFAAVASTTTTVPKSPKINYLAFLNLLPGLIQFAENIHGPSSGAQKLSMVTSLAQNALLTVASAGLVKPQIAQNVAAITDAVETTLTNMKKRSELNVPVPAA